jgi:hypothetical protein
MTGGLTTRQNRETTALGADYLAGLQSGCDPQCVHSGGRMNQIIRELKRQGAGEKLAPEQLKGLIPAGYVYRNGDEHFLTDKGRDALAQLHVQPGDGTLTEGASRSFGPPVDGLPGLPRTRPGAARSILCPKCGNDARPTRGQRGPQPLRYCRRVMTMYP